MENNRNYPKGVLDTEAYDKWEEMRKDFDNNPRRIYHTSNPNLKIDCAATIYIIERIKGFKELPVEEQEDIRERVREMRSITGKLAVLKRTSYGSIGKMDTGGIGPAYERQAEILELFGRWYKPAEVHKIITKDWGYDIGFNSVNEFYKRHVEKITELQREYEQSHSDVRLSKRRARLDELSWLYSKTKHKYLEGESREDAKLMQSLLESIKKEVDGDIVINGKIQVDIEHTINVQVQQEMLKEFNLTAYIIAKIAGRLNVNPMYITARLARSMYAKFTGFKGASKQQMNEDEIYYPSGIAYNFDEMLKKNEQIVEEDKKQQALPEMTIDDSNKQLSIIELMKLKIQQRQQNLQQSPIKIPNTD